MGGRGGGGGGGGGGRVKAVGLDGSFVGGRGGGGGGGGGGRVKAVGLDGYGSSRFGTERRLICFRGLSCFLFFFLNSPAFSFISLVFCPYLNIFLSWSFCGLLLFLVSFSLIKAFLIWFAGLFLLYGITKEPGPCSALNSTLGSLFSCFVVRYRRILNFSSEH